MADDELAVPESGGGSIGGALVGLKSTQAPADALLLTPYGYQTGGAYQGKQVKEPHDPQNPGIFDSVSTEIVGALKPRRAGYDTQPSDFTPTGYSAQSYKTPLLKPDESLTTPVVPLSGIGTF